MSFTNKWENEVLNYLLGGVAMTIPASLYVALHVGGTAPADDGTGIVEPSGGGYARVAVARNTTNFPQTTTGQVQNGATVTFPQATDDWGTVTHFALFDSQTGGNACIVGAVGTSKAVLNGDTASFGANGLSVSLT